MKLCKRELHLYDTKQCMECERAWRKANKERIYALNRAWKKENNYKRKTVNKEAARLWRKANRAKLTAEQIKREAAKMQRTPAWLTEVHFKQIELFYVAAHKLTNEFGIQMDVDHIVPLQGKNVSGLHVPWNLQVLPHSDNMSKGNR